MTLCNTLLAFLVRGGVGFHSADFFLHRYGMPRCHSSCCSWWRFQFLLLCSKLQLLSTFLLHFLSFWYLHIYIFVPTTTYLGIIYAYIDPAKVDLVVLRLEPTAQSLVGWSSAPALLHGGSAPSLRFQPLRVEDLSVVVSCLNCVCACVHRDVDRGLAEDGNTSALPLPSEGGGVESALPQPSPIVTKATLLPRPTGQNFHSYRPRSNNWSEKGKNRTRFSFSLLPTLREWRGCERERPGDHSRAEVSRRRTHRSRSISTDRSRSRGHARYSPPRSPSARSRSPRHQSQPWDLSWASGEQSLYYRGHPQSQGEHRSPTTSSGSHMPIPARIGTRLGPATARGHGIPHVAPRTAHGRESVITVLGIATTANTRPGSHTPSPAATAGPALRCPTPRCTIWTSLLVGTTGMRNSIGSMPHRRRTGTAATPMPRLRPGNTPTAPAVGPPWAGFPLYGIPRPLTHQQPKSLLQIGSHRTNLTANLTGGRLQAGRVRYILINYCNCSFFFFFFF